jgi:hypothetical protein
MQVVVECLPKLGRCIRFEIDLPPKPIISLKLAHRSLRGGLRAFVCGHSSRDRSFRLARFARSQL